MDRNTDDTDLKGLRRIMILLRAFAALWCIVVSLTCTALQYGAFTEACMLVHFCIDSHWKTVPGVAYI